MPYDSNSVLVVHQHNCEFYLGVLPDDDKIVPLYFQRLCGYQVHSISCTDCTVLFRVHGILEAVSRRFCFHAGAFEAV